jgi:hypothetical protein
MAAMPPSPAPRPVLTRRGLLAGSAAGLAVLVAGCTSSGGKQDAAATSRQADALAAQVQVQRSVVAAYAAAKAADPALGGQVADLAAQAGQQLDRLKAAAPGSRPAASSSASSASSSASSASSGIPAGQDPRTWLRGQVGAAADSHAAACLAQSGARAALLGSIAAGLRGQGAALT